MKRTQRVPAGTTCTNCGGFVRFGSARYPECRTCQRTRPADPLEDLIDLMDRLQSQE